MVSFVHLRLHSEYSLVDGLVRIKPLMQAVNTLKMPAVAVTDETNLFAVIKLQKAAHGAGIKPIFGADLWVLASNYMQSPTRLTLLVQNTIGYHNLTRLISKAYQQRQQASLPCISFEDLREMHAGLIVLSGAQEGLIGHLLLSDQVKQAQACLDEWIAVLGDRFYLELQRVGKPQEERYIKEAVKLAVLVQCPVVATNDVRFLQEEAFDAHEVRVCIHSGHVLEDATRPRNTEPEQYLKSPEQMQTLFADLPEALMNTVEIAKRCNLDIPVGTYHLPKFPIPTGMTMETFFRQVAREGLHKRLENIEARVGASNLDKQLYHDRLEEELTIILEMGFPGYFLIVMDFIKWAKDNAVPVGPGRGSGAGSLVAYALNITDLDPLEYDLLFERFLNPERVSMPDFDIDFCMDGRDRVIDYVAQRYGRQAVSQIITFGTMAAKAVVRDVGRVQGKAYGFVDRIAKLIPFELGMTLNKALEDEAQLRELFETDEDVKELLEMALKLEGITRNVGKHAGGVVIAPSDLTDFAPLYCDEMGANLVTQYDKDDVEQAGLVKFDFLGLRTLTIVDWAVQNIKACYNETLDIACIPLADEATFKLLQSGYTTAVFQLESRGMQDLIKRLIPSCFEDITALVALFRPGPLQSGMVDDFINRKHGRAEVTYAHPQLEPILKNTYGVILYQEQVMQIAQVLAGYTLGGADMLRRAMGKKKPEEMAKQREIFLKGALANEVSEDQATYIFDLMEKFAGYGFNKSHSAAYALISYQTAWLKAHYPAAFMAAVLSSDMDNTDKVVIFVNECRRMQLDIKSPDVNRSHYQFTVGENDSVIYGLGAVKGIGEGPAQLIVCERQAQGVFKSLFDFCTRIDLKKLNRRTLEALVRSGALDDFGDNRASLLLSLEPAIQYAEQVLRDKQIGITDLFGGLTGEGVPEPELLSCELMPERERLRGESQTLGLFLTGHPITEYRNLLKQFVSASLNKVKATNRGEMVVVAGLIVAMRTMKNKRGDRMAFLTLDDQTGHMEVSIFADVYEACRSYLVKDEILVVEGEVQHDNYTGQYKLLARSIVNIETAQENYARRLLLAFTAEKVGVKESEKLAEILTPYRYGRCSVQINYRARSSLAKLDLADDWKVTPKKELIEKLKAQLNPEAVMLEYS